MRIWCCAAVMVSLCAATTFAQNDPKPDELKKMYDDTLARLKDAQDRKNQLATENDKLAARVADLEKQLAVAQGQVDTLRRDSASANDRWFILRAQMSAWESFLNHDPELRARWIVFFENGFLAPPPALPMLGDPLAMIDASSSPGSTTQPDATTRLAQLPAIPATGPSTTQSVPAPTTTTIPAQAPPSTSSAAPATQPSTSH